MRRQVVSRPKASAASSSSGGTIKDSSSVNDCCSNCLGGSPKDSDRRPETWRRWPVGETSHSQSEACSSKSRSNRSISCF